MPFHDYKSQRRIYLEGELDSCLDWKPPWMWRGRQVWRLLTWEYLGDGLFHTKREEPKAWRDACCSVTGLRPTVAAQDISSWLLFHALKSRMLAEEQVVSIWAGKTT